MQNLKSLNKSYLYQYCLIILFSILLYGCNSNYLEIIAENELDNENIEKIEVSNQQINIDQLLEEK